MPYSPPPPADSRPVRAVPRRRAPDAPAREGGAHLRLLIARDGLGLELDEPTRVGCIEVTELTLSLPNLRFPLDVSGGVSRFRHRRGVLERLVVDVAARELEGWAAPRLRGVLGARPPEVWVAVRRAGATVAVVDRDAERVPPADAPPTAPRVLAFDVALDAEGDALALTITQARGSGLPAPATTLAIGAVQALLGKHAKREGARFVVESAARSLSRAILPDTGVRAPATDAVRWVALGAHGDRWLLCAEKGGTPAETTEDATRARELAALAREGDDARVAGDVEKARACDMAALERAPKHPELCRRIAEIDQLTGGRAEAALATLVEAEREATDNEGLLAAELLAEVGDTDAAVAALVRVGEREPAPALGARAFERAAELVTDPLDALVWLDMAVARAPRMAHLRWSRIGRRLAAGRLEDALADAEYLEALATGARARHAVWRRAGTMWQEARLRAEAAAVFERALRFEPDDALAIAGLGVALVESGRPARGTALLAHAIDLAEAKGEPIHAYALELARALAGPLDDRPSAIARVHGVPNDAREACEARALEARWRAELGDAAGASLAYARVRDLAGSRVAPPPAPASDADTAKIVAWLVEAAAFEAERREDPAAAQRHLGCALRLAPRNAAVQRAYRDIGRRVTGQHATAEASPAQASPTHPPHTQPPSEERASEQRAGPIDLDLPSDAPEDEAQAADAARVDELARALHADPKNDAIVDELADRLMRLGRAHELLALLSARLEDAAPERRAELVPKQRAVLERLEKDARAAGREGEASLFREAMTMLEP